MTTKIEWASETWNPVTGCDPVSEGCQHCYAKRMAQRLRGRCGYPNLDPFSVTVHADIIARPRRWRKPRMIFVCSMGDLFHPLVPRWVQSQVIATAIDCPQHQLLLLTKRPKTMRLFLTDTTPHPPNLWAGVTAENQRWADERVPILAKIPVAIRYLSVEPMLGPITPLLTGIHWVICGAETGPGARPMNIDWARSLRDQCVSAGVPFFFKKSSDGNRELDGQLWEEYPSRDSASNTQ